MTTARKIKSNRANARASTGPKTAHGKARAVRNARRYGLSVSIFDDPERSAEIDDLALKIAGEGAKSEIIELARSVAGAQIELARVRQAQHDLISREFNDPEFRPNKFFKDTRWIVREICKLLKPSDPDAVLPPDLAEQIDQVMNWKPEAAEKFAYVLSDLSQKLIALDRYERRALSRRKFAIRAFDLAARAAAEPALTNT